MLTELGKEMRKLRIDRGERLVDMATKMSCSAAFLSAVETGRKPAPESVVDDVVAAYGLDAVIAARFRQAWVRSRDSFVITAENVVARDTAALLARRFNALSEDQLRKIKEMLEG